MPSRAKKIKAPGKKIQAPRLPSSQRGYDRAHRAIRKQIAEGRIFCDVCHTRFGQEAHHIRYGDSLTECDYLWLCTTCHKDIERKKQGK